MASEVDLELLETFVDGELSPADAQQLQRRLASEPALTEELRRLQALRSVRESYFTALEPMREDVDGLIANVQEAIDRRKLRTIRIAWARYASALAACVVIGFFGGWLVKPGAPVTAPSTGVVVAAQVYQVSIRDESGQVVATQEFESLDQARAFARDLEQWQQRHEQLLSSQPTVRSTSF